MNLSDRDKRILKIAVPVLGGILVLFLAFTLFAGGGSEEVATPGPVLPSSSPLPSTSVSPTVTPSASPLIVFAGRDPFSLPPALASASLSPGASGSPSTSGSPPTSTSPTSSTTPPGTPSRPTAKDVGGRTVVILDTFTRDGVEKAQVQVDGTTYTVAEGARFAGNFRLVAVSGECGDFLYGEDSFTLCTNAQK